MHWADLSRGQLAVAAAIGLLCALLLLLRAVRDGLTRRALRQRMQRARRAELDAPSWLSELGYRVIATQIAGNYVLSIDGEPVEINVRADYLVERDGLRYVAEVKSGAAAPRIQTQATRRQLLEYRMAFDVDGALLVDGETQRVHLVQFPLSAPAPQRRGWPDAWWWAVTVIMLLAFMWLRVH